MREDFRAGRFKSLWGSLESNPKACVPQWKMWKKSVILANAYILPDSAFDYISEKTHGNLNETDLQQLQEYRGKRWDMWVLGSLLKEVERSIWEWRRCWARHWGTGKGVETGMEQEEGRPGLWEKQGARWPELSFVFSLSHVLMQS